MAERLLKKEGLPVGTPRYRYHGKMQLLNTLDDVSHQHHSYIILDGVDGRTCHRHFQEGRLGNLLKSCLIPYRIIVLNLKMESPVHSTAQAQFLFLVHDWSKNQTELLNESTGSVVQHSPRGKRPDGAWKPADVEANMPSVVVEIGWTEGPTKLRKDIEFWLEGETRAAISLNITKTGRMTLEAWRRNENGLVESHQRLYKNARGSVTGDFTIPFQAFYLRERREMETDFHITHETFSNMATKIQLEIKFDQARNQARKATARAATRRAAAARADTDDPDPTSG